MFLSNRDIQWAIDQGKLRIEPRPEAMGKGYDPVSIDLHLDHVSNAVIWDHRKFTSEVGPAGGKDGGRPLLYLGDFQYKDFAGRFLTQPPEKKQATDTDLVYRNGDDVYVRPSGFLLWTTKEKVGTPEVNSELMMFVNAKSTKARTGVVVHLTAPTIEATWAGNITLEIANFGPFTFVLRENDAIAALTVATISSPVDVKLRAGKSSTVNQIHPSARTN